MPMWNGWGDDASNRRFQNAKAAGLTAADVPKLKLKWAFGFPERERRRRASRPSRPDGSSSAPPTAWSMRSTRDRLHALDVQADGGVRTAIEHRALPARRAAHARDFGDIRANTYAVDAQTERCVEAKVDTYPRRAHDRRPDARQRPLYVPVSSIEEVPGARANYECCTFRGSVVALDVATGKQIWKTYTIPEEPKTPARTAPARRSGSPRAPRSGRRRRSTSRRTSSTSRPATPTPSRRRRPATRSWRST